MSSDLNLKMSSGAGLSATSHGAISAAGAAALAGSTSVATSGDTSGDINSSAQQIVKASGLPPKGSIIVSGMRSTYALHIGNYFGALKKWLALQNDYQGYYGVMNWHAMTSSYKTPHEVQGWARDIFADWLAWGLDPEKNVIFVQSEVPEHIELTMFFMMMTPMGWLERVPTWKDAEAEAKASDTNNLGRFMYPVLQAADIAVYRGTHVPIGQDQISHLELSREIVRRFNFLYATKLPEPRPVFSETPMLLGSDGRKMSKSYGNVFNLTQEPQDVIKTLKAMPTDPARVRRTDAGDPKKCPVFSYHELFSSDPDCDWVTTGCVTAGIGCGDCKMKLAENINKLMEEPREKKKQLLQGGDRLDSIIAEGCQRARTAAGVTLKEVREATGFSSIGALL
jgi:tryptophanyl-tRNA synthetase